MLLMKLARWVEFSRFWEFWGFGVGVFYGFFCCLWYLGLVESLHGIRREGRIWSGLGFGVWVHELSIVLTCYLSFWKPRLQFECAVRLWKSWAYLFFEKSVFAIRLKLTLLSNCLSNHVDWSNRGINCRAIGDSDRIHRDCNSRLNRNNTRTSLWNQRNRMLFEAEGGHVCPATSTDIFGIVYGTWSSLPSQSLKVNMITSLSVWLNQIG